MRSPSKETTEIHIPGLVITIGTGLIFEGRAIILYGGPADLAEHVQAVCSAD